MTTMDPTGSGDHETLDGVIGATPDRVTTIYCEYPGSGAVWLHNGDVLCEAAREGRVYPVRVASLVRWILLRRGLLEECIECWPTQTSFNESYQ